MAARIESPWKRLLPWLVVTVVLAGGAGGGGYWWLKHKKPAPANPKNDPIDTVAVVAPTTQGNVNDGSKEPPPPPPPPDSAKADEEDAALLPPDAIVFASVRVTDLVNSEAGK
jgi:hypothetical protein